MHRAGIEELLRRKPFRPFSLTVSSGHSFDVPHPEVVIVGRRLIAVAVPIPSGVRMDPDIVWIDYRHIVLLRPIQQLPSF